MNLETKTVPGKFDVIAPDGSEIRFLARTSRGWSVHCTLPPGAVSMAVAHRTVEELWFFLEGEGEVWRKWRRDEEVIPVTAGVSLNIPVGAHFQFRNTGLGPLRFVITTMPPWPGQHEAYRVTGRWPVPDEEPTRNSG
jgi:mannose-6-phosphate isomerase-like protein (cupin superfamily)